MMRKELTMKLDVEGDTEKEIRGKDEDNERQKRKIIRRKKNTA